jgi:hypothetical protein
MASTPYDPDTPHGAPSPYADEPAAAGGESEAPDARNVGEHIFIWIAWALAAAFWGATLTTLVGILRAAAAPSATVGTSGPPGGSAFLVLVVTAFASMAIALAYGSLRSISRPARAGEKGATAVYDGMERPSEEEFPTRTPGAPRGNREFR